MNIRRTAARMVGVALAAMALTVAAGGVANADTGFGDIIPVSASIGGLFTSPKCLDVREQDGFDTPNARIQLWDCSGANEQQWSSHPYAVVSRVTLYQIKNLRSGMCMEVRGGGTALHAVVDQYPCGTGSVNDLANQLWLENSDGNGNFELEPWSALQAGVSRCLDVVGNKTDNQTMLQQYTCTGNNNQRFIGSPLINS